MSRTGKINTVRGCRRSDLGPFVALYEHYAKEAFQIDTPITEEVVERDGFGKRFNVAVSLE
jgi:hypothetical protein